MTGVKNQHEGKNPADGMLHIPVWGGIIALLLIAAFFYITLTPSPTDKALFQAVALTATQQWADAANPQTAVTEATKAATTPTLTPTDAATSTPVPTETPALAAGSFKISDTDGMKMMYVPAGSFIMGGNDGGSQNEPAHEVVLSPYWIDQTEVSNKMYALCVTAGSCSPPAAVRSTNLREYYGNPNHADYPVIFVSWFQAQEYCKWVGRQLPTEAQWEKAARGEDGLLYPWGDIFDDGRGNFRPLETGFDVVGSYPGGKSQYGALNMSGNVYEWVSDWFDQDYYQSEEYWINPLGPVDGDYRVIKGGLFRQTNEKQSGRPNWLNSITKGYIDITINFFPGFRMYLKPDGASHLVGFRCVVGPDN